MTEQTSRRTVLATGAALVGGNLTSIGSSTASTPGRSLTIRRRDTFDALTVRAQSFERQGKQGKIPTRIEYDSIQIADINTLLWSAAFGRMQNVRDDATRGSMVRTDPDIPELIINNRLTYADPNPPHPRYNADYSAECYKRLVLSDERPALLLDGTVAFQRNAPGSGWDREFEHTVYTLWNPDISTYRQAQRGDEAFAESRDGYDVVAATAHDAGYVAYVSRHQPTSDSPQTAFDGLRIGTEGTTSGPDQSAWHDIYEEADGWIDSNERNTGNIDVGVGLYGETDQQIRWTSAFGFGDSWQAAADAAIETVETGYETERSAWS
jgi:hypothetical protein